MATPSQTGGGGDLQVRHDVFREFAAAPPRADRSGKIWRIVLGALVVASLAAAGLMMYPPGGSADEVERQYSALQTQVATKRIQLAKTRQNVAAVAKGRAEGDEFLGGYFLARRTAYSTLLSELVSAADQSQVKPKEHAYATEPIEGSDTLSMMTITANYEGTYANLMRFVNAVDRSPRLLIIEGLSAAPQQTGGVLSVAMKIDAFVREDGSGDVVPEVSSEITKDVSPASPKNAGSAKMSEEPVASRPEAARPEAVKPDAVKAATKQVTAVPPNPQAINPVPAAANRPDGTAKTGGAQ